MKFISNKKFDLKSKYSAIMNSMNVDLKSHYFMQSQFKSSNNSLSKNVVTGFDQKKSQFNLESESKECLKKEKKDKKEKNNKDPHNEKNEKKSELNKLTKKTINKLMNII
jgi:hypothetical protein